MTTATFFSDHLLTQGGVTPFPPPPHPIFRNGSQGINDSAIPHPFLALRSRMESGDHKYSLHDSRALLVSGSRNDFTVPNDNPTHNPTHNPTQENSTFTPNSTPRRRRQHVNPPSPPKPGRIRRFILSTEVKVAIPDFLPLSWNSRLPPQPLTSQPPAKSKRV